VRFLHLLHDAPPQGDERVAACKGQLPEFNCLSSYSASVAFCFPFAPPPAPTGAWGGFLSSMIILQAVGPLGRGISSSQGRYLHTGQHIHTPNIHALCGTRTHVPGFRANEDSSCFRPLGYRDRHFSLSAPYEKRGGLYFLVLRERERERERVSGEVSDRRGLACTQFLDLF
jgi:hypothetical protein